MIECLSNCLHGGDSTHQLRHLSPPLTLRRLLSQRINYQGGEPNKFNLFSRKDTYVCSETIITCAVVYLEFMERRRGLITLTHLHLVLAL